MTSSLGAAATLPRARAVSINPTPCPAEVPPAVAAAAAAPAAVAPGVSANEGETLTLLLAPIVARLPQELQAALVATPSADASVTLPLAGILEQLATGAVRFPLGQIRQGCSEACFSAHANFDQLLVTIPLEEVLARLSPAQLPRRARQATITIPDSVTAPFAGRTATPLVVPEVRPPVAPAPVSIAAPAVAAAPAAAPAAVVAPAASVVSAVDTSAVTATDVVQPAPAGGTEVKGARRETSFLRAGSLALPLTRLAGNWPAPVLQEVANQNLAGATVELPLAEVEAGLKQGRLAFTWRQIRGWTPAVPKPLADSALDSTALELPLRFVAPLFLSQKPQPQRKRVEVGEGIPNIFGPGTVAFEASAFQPQPEAASRKPVAAVTASAEPRPTLQGTAAASPPLRMADSAPAVATPAATPQTSFLRRTVDEILDEPGKTNWTPMEIVRKISRMRGVAGATIATQDGLMVAEQYPALVGTDTFCALTTQLFNRVFNTAMELRLGGPARLSFVAESVTYEIHRCGRLYLAVISQPGEKLPSPELTIIAEHLTNQSR